MKMYIWRIIYLFFNSHILRVHSARYTQCIHVSSRKLKLPEDIDTNTLQTAPSHPFIRIAENKSDPPQPSHPATLVIPSSPTWSPSNICHPHLPNLITQRHLSPSLPNLVTQQHLSPPPPQLGHPATPATPSSPTW